MHQRLIVLSSQDETKGSIEPTDVSHDVHNWLTEEGFANQSGRWSSGPSDWFVIGGRWSGELTKFKHKITYEDSVNFLKSAVTKSQKEEMEKNSFGVSSDLISDYKHHLNKWWQKKTNSTISHPWCRDSYAHLGYGDDSMRLTKDLFDNIKEDLEEHQSEESWIAVDHWNNEHDYLDYSTDLKDIIKNKMWYDEDDLHQTKNNVKWLTVVDYHN